MKAEPGALAAFPGSVGADPVAQLNPAVVPGWPVVGFWRAAAMPVGTATVPNISETTQTTRRTVFMAVAPSC